jgi:predicted ATP-grasp superfamily ATP-dependent carboligase
MAVLEPEPSVSERIVIAGTSTRAAADSAARAGFDVTAIDAFGDLDQHPRVVSLSLLRDLGVRTSASAAARAARPVACAAVAYVSAFDNHPRAVATLAAGRALWGNRPAVLRRVRDPRLVAEALGRRGMATPAVFAPPRLRAASGATAPRPAVIEPAGLAEARWLLKPLASGGGYRVRPWRRGARIPAGCYLQSLVEGTPASVVFVAATGRAVPFGVSRQLVGEAAFGASGYRYCGSILACAGDVQFERDAALVHAACAMARAIAEEFDLVGVNGIDFVARGGVPWPIEVNPRWSASMELVERAYGLSVFGVHADACVRGSLPDFNLPLARQGSRAYGKAVVFARREVVVGDTRPWLEDTTVRDVPHPGERIRAGQPVCTVFADAAESAACHASLVRRADCVYQELALWEREIA